MLYKTDETTENTYGFDFQVPSKLDAIATIRSIGIEHRTSESHYFWDCSARIDTDTFIFQYTLAGCGEINIAGKKYALPKDYAFIIAVPENCRYYLPVNSPEWKFVFITMEGIEARKCWEFINENYGQVVKISDKKMIIQQLLSTYTSVLNSQLLDMYRVSHKAYEFLTYCYRHFETKYIPEVVKMPDDIKKSIDYIEQNFHLPLSIDDISAHIDMSRSHLSRKFKTFTGVSMLDYLNKHRIEKSILLLLHTSKPIKEIASETGFADASYFCKIFKKYTGISPNSSRNLAISKHGLDYLITDKHGIIDLE